MQTATPKARSLLDRVIRGKRESPPRVLIVGQRKIGKSTLANGFPDPIFLDADHGLDHVDVHASSGPLPNYDATIAWLDALAQEDHPYRTLVVDTLDALEGMMIERLFHGSGVHSKPHGRGYLELRQEWRSMLQRLEDLWTRRKMGVVLLSHCELKTHTNPEGDDYDAYRMTIYGKAETMVQGWVDVIAFARHERYQKEVAGKRLTHLGRRVLRCQPSPAYPAGARFNLPEELDLDADALLQAITADTPRPVEELVAEYETLLSAVEIPDETREKARAYLKRSLGNADALCRGINHLKSMPLRVEEQEQEQEKKDG